MADTNQATATATRNVVVCCDGTGNEFSTHRSNVLRADRRFKQRFRTTRNHPRHPAAPARPRPAGHSRRFRGPSQPTSRPPGTPLPRRGLPEVTAPALRSLRDTIVATGRIPRWRAASRQLRHFRRQPQRPRAPCAPSPGRGLPPARDACPSNADRARRRCRTPASAVPPTDSAAGHRVACRRHAEPAAVRVVAAAVAGDGTPRPRRSPPPAQTQPRHHHPRRERSRLRRPLPQPHAWAPPVNAIPPPVPAPRDRSLDVCAALAPAHTDAPSARPSSSPPPSCRPSTASSANTQSARLPAPLAATPPPPAAPRIGIASPALRDRAEVLTIRSGSPSCQPVVNSGSLGSCSGGPSGMPPPTHCLMMPTCSSDKRTSLRKAP